MADLEVSEIKYHSVMKYNSHFTNLEQVIKCIRSGVPDDKLVVILRNTIKKGYNIKRNESNQY